MAEKSTRSSLGRAVWLGSAKAGILDWWRERVTAVALIPLTLWLVASIIAHSSSDYPVFVAWLKAPFVALMVVLLLIALFYHVALGLQVVIEDYIHSAMKIPTLVVMRFACFACAGAGILATLRLAFTG